MYPNISITSYLVFPTYHFLISLSICIGLFWLVRRTEQLQLKRKTALDLSLIIMVFGLIGARLFHVFYEDFEFYQEDWLRIFKIWNGGFVFYGGAALASIIGIPYLRLQTNNNIGPYLDLFAPVLAFTYAAGRSACFFAGCCYGRSCELPWAIAGLHPTQLYGTSWELGVLLILLAVEKGNLEINYIKWTRRPGDLFYLWMIFHGVGRMILEVFRADFRGPIFILSISSWISLGVIALGAWFFHKNSNGLNNKI